jgi:hypothetical protein
MMGFDYSGRGLGGGLDGRCEGWLKWFEKGGDTGKGEGGED